MARVMSVSPVPPTELLLEMKVVLGVEARPEPMSVVVERGESAGETELGRAGPLVRRKCRGSGRASLGLP